MRTPGLNLIRKTGSLIVAISFLVTSLYIPPAQAQVAFLPAAGSMISMTPAFNPMEVKGIKFYPDNPFKFDFIVDRGDVDLSQEQIKDQGKRLISYFLASLTTPEKEMWVNLSPYEKSRIIPTSFGQTEMGKDLLSQDYILKQIMATALYPERQMGREFWQKVYTEAARRFGTTNVPVSTYNKVWIVPDKAVIYENSLNNSVFVVESSLKVMLEQDYLAANKNKAREQFGITDISDRQHTNAVRALSAQIIKEIVIPALEKEVNYGRNFAPLRQVYQSLILATWYKKNLKDSLLSQGYVDRHKVMGINVKDKNIIQKIYHQYLRAYRKGVYNYIKEEIDPTTQQMIPRKYFSGGFAAAMLVVTKASPAQLAGFLRKLTKKATTRLMEIVSNFIPAKTKMAIGVGFLVFTAAVGASNAHGGVLGPQAGPQHHPIVDIRGSATVRHVVPGIDIPTLTYNLNYNMNYNLAEHLVQPVTEAAPSNSDEGPGTDGLGGGAASGGSGPGNGSGGSGKPGNGHGKGLGNKSASGSSSFSHPGTDTSIIAPYPLSTHKKKDEVGGIDLEKIILNTNRQGKGVVTAFSDPRILEMLRKSDGLEPVIYEIRPMTLPMMNVLLGFNFPEVNNKLAQNEDHASII